MASCFSITSPSRKKSYFFHISRRGLPLQYHAPFLGSVTQASGKDIFSKLKKDKKIFLLSFPAQKKDFFPFSTSRFSKSGRQQWNSDKYRGCRNQPVRISSFPGAEHPGGKINVCTDTKKGRRWPAGGAGQRLLGREIFGLRRTVGVARGIPAFRP